MKVSELFESEFFGYHATLASNVDSIKQNGFTMQTKADPIYFANTPESALTWGKALHGNDVPLAVFKVRLEKHSKYAVIQVHHSVPASDIVDVALHNTVKEDGDAGVAGVDASDGMAIPNKKWKKILLKKVPPSMNPYKKSK